MRVNMFFYFLFCVNKQGIEYFTHFNMHNAVKLKTFTFNVSIHNIYKIGYSEISLGIIIGYDYLTS